MKNSDFIIREIKPAEVYLLENFLYEAIFQKDGTDPLPREIVNSPELRIYTEDFGKPDDFCLVAVHESEIVGAAWARILAGDPKGYGHMDARTPELSISLYKEYRDRGIGTELIQSMLQMLKERGYQQVSLSVQKDNRAVRLYKKIGFTVAKEIGEEFVMVYHISE